MKNNLKLFMAMLGCKPLGRNIEQHDVFFGIGENLGELVPNIKSFWPEAETIHIDAWREITNIDGFKINVSSDEGISKNLLYFVNLGGYSRGSFNELHECHLIVAETLAKAIKKSKGTDFYKSKTFEGAVSHVDDKFAVDVDDACRVSDLIAKDNMAGLFITIEPCKKFLEVDQLHIGYLKLEKLN